MIWLTVLDRAVLVGDDGSAVAVPEGGPVTREDASEFGIAFECSNVRDEPEFERSITGRALVRVVMLKLFSRVFRYREIFCAGGVARDKGPGLGITG